MSESIHIFDQFLSHSESNNERHAKRMTLDPMIYDCLKQKYFQTLKNAFQNYRAPPSDTTAAVCLIERRIHPNLEFLIYNIAYFAKDWKIVVCCSDINIHWLIDVLGERASQIHFIQVFSGSPDRDKGRMEYNTLMQNADFYRMLPAENLLCLEMDCYIRKHLPLDTWKQFDYIASPSAWNEKDLVGGASFRKRSVMIEVCEKYKSDEWAQDIYADKGTQTLGFKRPTFEEAIPWFTESCLYEDPVVVHQWWTFFSPTDVEDAELIFKSLLSLEIS